MRTIDWWSLVLMGGVVLLDQVSKWWAVSHGWVSHNPGISFGLAQSWPVGGVIMASLGVIGSLGLLWKKSPMAWRWPLSLVLGGGISNIIDRITVSSVRDWLPLVGGLQNNVADWAIGLGVVWLVLSSKWVKPRVPQEVQ